MNGMRIFYNGLVDVERLVVHDDPDEVKDPDKERAGDDRENADDDPQIVLRVDRFDDAVDAPDDVDRGDAEDDLDD